MHRQMSSAKCRPSCPRGYELKDRYEYHAVVVVLPIMMSQNRCIRARGTCCDAWQHHCWLVHSCVSHCLSVEAMAIVSGNFNNRKYAFFYFLDVILCPEHTTPLKTIIYCSFRHCRQGRSFLTLHCDVTTVDLWHHMNTQATGIVTSYSLIVFACSNWCTGNFH